MLPDCIDPKTGGVLCQMMSKSVLEILNDFAGEFEELWEARLHWNSCPACRHEFASVPEMFAQVGLGLANNFRGELSKYSNDFLVKKRLLSEAINEMRSSHPEPIQFIRWLDRGALLAASNELPRSYSGLIVELVQMWDDVFSMVIHGQDVLGLYSPASDIWRAEGQVLSICEEFICSLKPDVQHYVASSAIANDLLAPVRTRMYRQSELPYAGMPRDEEIDRRYQAAINKSRTSPDVSYLSEIDRRFQAAIASSEISPDVLFRTIELAATGYIRSHIDNLTNTNPAIIVQTEPSIDALIPRAATVLPNVLQEFKQDFDNALDSLKAGQMETMRLIEHNQRPAAAYEADIEARLGAFLYSRLGETTRLGLQVAEYLYHINSQEPNYFHGPVMQMALAYENELAVRVIWPFVSEMQNAGAEAYDGQGVSREPLLSGGKVPGSCMMLGNLARYLRKDPFMRSKISALGFDVDAIAKDAISIASLRNMAAHAPFCERAVADDLRKRMLCRDSVFSRFHPMAAIVPSAS